MKEVNFKCVISTAHRLYPYEGKCANVHGHNYTVAIKISTYRLTDDMVIEWQYVKDAVDHFDHAILLHSEDPLVDLLAPHTRVVTMKQRPTTENFAHLLAEHIGGLADGLHVQVTLSETESIVATGKFS